MKKRNWLLLAMAVVLVFALTACGNGDATDGTGEDGGTADAATGEFEITFGHPFNPGTPQALIADEFKSRIEEESGGRITVTIFPAGQLGSHLNMYEGLQMGTQQMAILPSARVTGFAPSLQIFDLPFLFPDRETAYEIFDGEVGAALMETLKESGVRGLAVCEDGFKHFTASKPIAKLEDFNGLKMRTMESPIIMEQFNCLGSNPVPIDYAELYNALQQKTVDGQENPLASIATLKLYEVQDYLLYSEHAYLPQLLLMSEDFYNSLPADLQELVDKVSKDVAAWQRQLVQDEEAEYLKEIEDYGATITYLDDAERERMKEALAPVYEAARDIVDPDLLDLVVEAAQK